ncbi:MAG: 2-succinyl-5-enolpyruvyl-6-hydroxy-3-cyclohexene-1-carboxylic-acid synthase [Bdellovibrio sp.]|nr:2-succinyl-5-enolpyruvyl-6-hydroxy-3-cyclohexene-1-carboxylic-acid synthase [Bdellovibrio sp.]
MTNFDLCNHVFSFLKQINCDTVIICAGARNAPFVFNLETESFKKVFFFEERSAAFFALGLMKQQGRPVAIITTSGTAVAELLPATIESFYQGLPLVLITADRPKTYRHSGAPQAIQQVGIFTDYVEQSYDWDVLTPDFNIQTQLQKPIHLNVCFDEPLIDKATSSPGTFSFEKKDETHYPKAMPADFSSIKNPLVIVSQIDPKQKNEVLNFLLALKAPVYLEALSQLKGESQLEPYLVNSSDTYVKKVFQDGSCDSVIRIGGVPTLRFWRDLEDKFKDCPVFNFTNLPFSGLSRKTKNFNLDLSQFTSIGVSSKLQLIKDKDLQLTKIKTQLLGEHSMSEPACVRSLSLALKQSALYLGNSLPIREWDLFADIVVAGQQPVYGNRGANGIDGQVSSYLGWSQGFRESWCLIGDLTAMYDLAALGLTNQLDTKNKKRIVVMNNHGGHIFKRVFNTDHFLNSHQIEFEMWAKMWKWDYLKVTSIADFKLLESHQSPHLVVEIKPDGQQTTTFWNAWDDACRKI